MREFWCGRRRCLSAFGPDLYRFSQTTLDQLLRHLVLYRLSGLPSHLQRASRFRLLVEVHGPDHPNRHLRLLRSG